jgi:hypothetical protein
MLQHLSSKLAVREICSMDKGLVERWLESPPTPSWVVTLGHSCLGLLYVIIIAGYVFWG